MKMRFKVLLGVMVFGVLLIGLTAGYLAIVPKIPTGYEEIAKQRREDVRAQQTVRGQKEAGNDGAPAAGDGAKAAVHAAPETPRQRFERCLAVVVKSEPAYQRALAKLIDFYNDSQLNPWGYRTVEIGQREWDEKIGKLITGTLAYEQALRRLVNEQVDFEKDPKIHHHYGKISVAAKRAALAEAAKAEPIKEAAELLRLPTGAVPEIPAGPQGLFRYDYVFILYQAYLHALAREPDFDALAGLRRLYELQRFARFSGYPNWTIWANQSIDPLLEMIAASGLADSRKLVALAKEAGRITVENRDPAKALEARARICRYQAQVIRDQLTNELDDYLSGKKESGNTFHFFWGGTPERLWMKANEGNMRRQIDLLAVAVASGDRAEMMQAEASLWRALKLGNIPRNQIQGDYLLADMQGGNAGGILRMAITAWWLDHGTLPERIADLKPAYFDEGVDLIREMTVWIEDRQGQKVLMQATVMPFGHEMREMARDEKKFYAALAQFEKRTGKKPTPEQIEQGRTMLRDAKNFGAKITVTGRLLNIE